ncbi:MAG: SDR family oxidoreductase [Burkholderiales bacterium]|nr:SDR family oxidoreductase [Burkholderiales bacterium]
MSPPVAVVTGANRGIGLGAARRLARQGMCVVLTARDRARGEAACASLAAEGLDVRFHGLDVRSRGDADALGEWLAAELGRLDVLVNNAGVLLDPRGSRALDVAPELVRDTMETNVLGVLGTTQALAPLLRQGGRGRVVNVSSELGQLADMGIGSPAYRMSKAALNALTRILAQELAASGVKVNAMSPGWVRTGLGGANAPRSVDEAADTIAWLATLPDDGPSGGFFKDRRPIPW